MEMITLVVIGGAVTWALLWVNALSGRVNDILKALERFQIVSISPEDVKAIHATIEQQRKDDER